MVINSDLETRKLCLSECSVRYVPLSIAIPAFNRCNSVLTLLESVCAQVGEQDEVIVSDDASTDGTAERSSAMPGVKVIQHATNQGMVPNWNECIRAAARDWICIIHDDDGLEPGGLAAIRRACALANGPALVVHQYAGDRYGDAFRCLFSEPNSSTVLNCPTIPSGAVIHRHIVEQLGEFDPHFRYSSDLEYFARIAARFPVLIIESPRVVEYRLHGANYQIQTWRRADFYDQFEELQGLILSYAGIRDDKLKRNLLEERMARNLFYMLNVANQTGDRNLVRQVGRNCLRFRHRLSGLRIFKARIAAATGCCLHIGRKP
jgi:glycosyltransferase involved in cell wall biosynthesis